MPRENFAQRTQSTDLMMCGESADRHYHDASLERLTFLHEHPPFPSLPRAFLRVDIECA